MSEPSAQQHHELQQQDPMNQSTLRNESTRSYNAELNPSNSTKTTRNAIIHQLTHHHHLSHSHHRSHHQEPMITTNHIITSNHPTAYQSSPTSPLPPTPPPPPPPPPPHHSIQPRPLSRSNGTSTPLNSTQLHRLQPHLPSRSPSTRFNRTELPLITSHSTYPSQPHPSRSSSINPHLHITQSSSFHHPHPELPQYDSNTNYQMHSQQQQRFHRPVASSSSNLARLHHPEPRRVPPNPTELHLQTSPIQTQNQLYPQPSSNHLYRHHLDQSNPHSPSLLNSQISESVRPPPHHLSQTSKDVPPYPFSSQAHYSYDELTPSESFARHPQQLTGILSSAPHQHHRTARPSHAQFEQDLSPIQRTSRLPSQDYAQYPSSHSQSQENNRTRYNQEQERISPHDPRTDPLRHQSRSQPHNSPRQQQSSSTQSIQPSSAYVTPSQRTSTQRQQLQMHYQTQQDILRQQNEQSQPSHSSRSVSASQSHPRSANMTQPSEPPPPENRRQSEAAQKHAEIIRRQGELQQTFEAQQHRLNPPYASQEPTSFTDPGRRHTLYNQINPHEPPPRPVQKPYDRSHPSSSQPSHMIPQELTQSQAQFSPQIVRSQPQYYPFETTSSYHPHPPPSSHGFRQDQRSPLASPQLTHVSRQPPPLHSPSDHPQRPTSLDVRHTLSPVYSPEPETQQPASQPLRPSSPHPLPAIDIKPSISGHIQNSSSEISSGGHPPASHYRLCPSDQPRIEESSLDADSSDPYPSSSRRKLEEDDGSETSASPEQQSSTESFDDGVIRCICSVTTDDGFTIQCETCEVWQHAVCVGIPLEEVPEHYFCDQCEPSLDRRKELAAMAHRAERLQQERIIREASNRSRGSQVTTDDDNIINERYYRTTVLENVRVVASPIISAVMSRAPSSASVSDSRAELATSINSHSSSTKNKAKDSQQMNVNEKTAQSTSRKTGKSHSTIPFNSAGIASLPAQAAPRTETNVNTLGLCGLIENASKDTMLAPREIPARKPGRRSTKSNQSRPQVSKATLEPISISNANSLGTGVDYDNPLPSGSVSNQVDLDERYEAWRHEFTPTAKDRYFDADVKSLISQLVAQHMSSHRNSLHDATLEPEGSDHFATSEDTASPEVNRTGPSLVGKTDFVSELYPADSNLPPSAPNILPKSAESNHKGSRTNSHAFDQSRFMPVTMPELPSPLKLTVKIITLASTNFAPTFATNPFYPTFAATAATTSTSALPRLITHGVFATHSIARGTFVGYLKGSITTLKKYTSELCNQYSNIGCNKPHVKFFKSTRVDSMAATSNDGLVIDSRQYGNENRFIRSGCHPNAFINIILTPHPSISEETHSSSNTPSNRSPSQYSDRHVNQVEMTDGRDLIPEILDHDLHLPWEVTFGVFAAADISRREEIVLPWDWDDHHIIHLLPKLLNHSNTFEAQLQSSPQRSPISTVSQFLPWSSSDLKILSSKMASITLTLFGLTICGCEKKRSCALNLMWKIGCLSAGLPIFPVRSEVEEAQRSSTLLSMSSLKEKSDSYTFEEKLRIVLNSFLEQPNQNGVTNKSGRLLQPYPSFTNYNFNVTHPNRIKKHKIDLGPLLGLKRNWWNFQPSIQEQGLGIDLAISEKGNKRARSGSDNSIPAISKLRRVSDTIGDRRPVDDNNGSNNQTEDRVLEPEDEVVASDMIRSQEMIEGSPPPALPPESKTDLDEPQATSPSPILRPTPTPAPPSPQEDPTQLQVEDDRLQSTEISSDQPVKEEIIDDDVDMALAEQEPVASLVDRQGEPDSVDTDGMDLTLSVTEGLNPASANGDLIVDQEVDVPEKVEGRDIIMDEAPAIGSPLPTEDLASTVPIDPSSIDPSPKTQPMSPSMIVDDNEGNLTGVVRESSREIPRVGQQNGHPHSSEVKVEDEGEEDIVFDQASSEVEVCIASDASTIVLGSSDEDLLSLSKGKRPKPPKVIANKPSPPSRAVVEPKIINPPVKRRKGRVILSSASSSSPTDNKNTKSTNTNSHTAPRISSTPSSSSMSNQSGDEDDDDNKAHINIRSRATKSTSVSFPSNIIGGSSGKIDDAPAHEDVSMSGIGSDMPISADLSTFVTEAIPPIVDQPLVAPQSEAVPVAGLAPIQLTPQPLSAPQLQPEPAPEPVPVPVPTEDSEPLQDPAPRPEPEEPKVEPASVPKPPPPKRISLKDYRSRRVQEPSSNSTRTVTSPILRFSKPNEIDSTRRKLSQPPPPPLSSLPPLLPHNQPNQPLLPLSPRKLELVASVLKKDDRMREEEKIEEHKEEKTPLMDRIISTTVEETSSMEVFVPNEMKETPLMEMIQKPLEAQDLAVNDSTSRLEQEQKKQTDLIMTENLSKAVAEVPHSIALLEDDLDGSTIENMSISGSYEEEGEYREFEALQDKPSLSNEATAIHHAQSEEVNHTSTEQYETVDAAGSTSNQSNHLQVNQSTISDRLLGSPEQFSIPLDPIQDPVVKAEPKPEVSPRAEARRPRLSLAAYRLRLAESRPSSSETHSNTDQQRSQAMDIDPESPSDVRAQQTSPLRKLVQISELTDDQPRKMMTDEPEMMDIDQNNHDDHDNVSLSLHAPAVVLDSVSDERQLQDDKAVSGQSAEPKVEQLRKNSMYFPPFSPSLLMGGAGLSQSPAPPSSPQPGEIDVNNAAGRKAIVSSPPFRRSRSRTPPEPYPASPSAEVSTQCEIPTNHLNAEITTSQSRGSSLPVVLPNTTSNATKIKEEEDTSEGEIDPRKQNFRIAETESPKGFRRVLSPKTSAFPQLPSGSRNGESTNPKTTNPHQWPVPASKPLHRTNMQHTSSYSNNRFESYRLGSRSPTHNHLTHFNSRSNWDRDGHVHPLRSRSPTKSPHLANSTSPPTRYVEPSADRDISPRASSSSWISAPPRGPRASQGSSSAINTTTTKTTATTTHTNSATHRANWPPRRSSAEPQTNRPDSAPTRIPPRNTSSSGRGSIVGSTTSGPGPPHLTSVPIGPRSTGIRNERARYEGPLLSPSHRVPRAPASMSSSIPATYGGSNGSRGRAKIRGSAQQYWGNSNGNGSSNRGCGGGGSSSSSRNER